MANPFPLHHLADVDSTNAEAARIAASGALGPLLIVADAQSAGRGRLGREWHSRPGNLYSTLLLPVSAALQHVPQLSFVVALAVHDMVKQLAPAAPVALKWPNDCLLQGAKLSGILCEVVSQAPLRVALGCGINVSHAPLGLPYPAAWLQQAAPDATLEAVQHAYAQQLRHWLGIWDNGQGFASIAQAWQQRAIGMDEMMTVTSGGSRLEGRMAGIDGAGALLLRDAAGKLHHIHAGDVFIPSLQALRGAV